MNIKQSAKNILMIRPTNFDFNEETADSNAFQTKADFNKHKITAEFDSFVEKLKANGVTVFVFDDTVHPPKPDAIFPNNWISFHSDGIAVLYPMYAENRRTERRSDVVEKLKETFNIKKIIDLSEYEQQRQFLEGTGSIVFDHENKFAYACLSPRTNKKLFTKITKQLAYKPISFHALDSEGKEIYHTNVMMCIGQEFAVICLDSIKNEAERKSVTDSLLNAEKEIIEISVEQMNNFAGNMLAVSSNKDETVLIMSEKAFKVLNNKQKKKLANYCKILPVSISTIEKIGGGSARCMMAEIFSPEI